MKKDNFGENCLFCFSEIIVIIIIIFFWQAKIIISDKKDDSDKNKIIWTKKILF